MVRTRKYWIIAATIAIIVTVAWLIRVDADVKLVVVTDNVILDVVDTWAMKLDAPLKLQSLYVDHVDINATRKANTLSVNIESQVEKQHVFLEALNVIHNGQTARVELATDANALNMYVKMAYFDGKFHTPGFAEMDKDGANSGIGPPQEVIFFKTKPLQYSGTRIEMCTKAPWLLCDLPIRKMVLVKENREKPGTFEPSVQSGQVQVLNSGRTIQLGWGDVLSLAKIEQIRRIIIKPTSGGFKISFLGKTAAIAAGPQGYEDDLRPRYLEYIYNNSKNGPLALFLFAISILWAGYFHIHSSIRKKEGP